MHTNHTPLAIAAVTRKILNAWLI